MGRRHFFPEDDVTVGEWSYLLQRFSAEDAAERRLRVGQTLKRFVRKGRNPKELHLALMKGTRLWEAHVHRQMTRQAVRRRNETIARARKDVDRALASLRRLVPQGFLRLEDDDLFALRKELLVSVDVPPATQPRGGRPWTWKQETEEALRQSGIGASDRRELIAALGFVDDD